MKHDVALAYGRLTGQFGRFEDSPTREEDVETIVGEVRRLEFLLTEIHMAISDHADSAQRIKHRIVTREAYKIPSGQAVEEPLVRPFGRRE